MTDITIPTIHFNGTSRSHLLAQVREAHEAATLLIKKLCEASPHARDYYPQGSDAIRVADAHWRVIVNKAIDIEQFTEKLAIAIIDAPGPK